MFIKDLENYFKKAFDDSNSTFISSDSVYEKGDGFYKLVISFHDITYNNNSVIHTKFIFKTNLDKTELIDNSFVYLYNFNCVYEKVKFTNGNDLIKKISNIFSNMKFGDDMKYLSEFIEAPAMFLNHYFNENDIKNISVYDVEYQPKFKMTPCSEITFDFEINISDKYNIYTSIKKVGKNEYTLRISYLDKSNMIEFDSTKHIHLIIGKEIINILEDLV